MFASHLRAAAVVVAAVGLSGCAYNGLYSGISVGYGNAGYYDPYYGYGYGAGYPGYGYGLSYAPYWGWYDNFYYPGTGFYVYDIYRRPHRWTDAQRRYWEIRRQRALATGTASQPVVIRDNWGEFDRNRDGVRQIRRDRDETVRIQRTERPVRAERPVREERRAAQGQARSERVSTRGEGRTEARQQRIEARGERRGRGHGRDRDGTPEE